MSPQTQSNPTEQLLASRQGTHGDTYVLTSLVVEALREPFINMVIKHPQFIYVWVMVISKAIRVLFDPFHRDHWDDIIGYATLAKRLVEKGNADGTNVPTTPTDS